MNEQDTYLSINREYRDLDRYRELLVGEKIKSVHFATDSDEGLVITCESGHTLYFGFSGCEGTIIVGEK